MNELGFEAGSCQVHGLHVICLFGVHAAIRGTCRAEFTSHKSAQTFEALLMLD
jgi:hypothetical protein